MDPENDTFDLFDCDFLSLGEVRAFDLPHCIINMKAATAVNDWLFQGENAADILRTAAVEVRLIGFDWTGLEIAPRDQDADNLQYSEN